MGSRFGLHFGNGEWHLGEWSRASLARCAGVETYWSADESHPLHVARLSRDARGLKLIAVQLRATGDGRASLARCAWVETTRHPQRCLRSPRRASLARCAWVET